MEIIQTSFCNYFIYRFAIRIRTVKLEKIVFHDNKCFKSANTEVNHLKKFALVLFAKPRLDSSAKSCINKFVDRFVRIFKIVMKRK